MKPDNIIIILIIPVLTSLLISCSPQKKLANLIKHHPELVKSDTVMVQDTLIIGSIHTDTIFNNTITKDTVILEKEKLKIKYYNNGKTVYLAGEVKTDTIIKTIPVEVNTVTPAEKYIPPLYQYSLYSLIFLLLCIIIYIYKRYET